MKTNISLSLLKHLTGPSPAYHPTKPPKHLRPSQNRSKLLKKHTKRRKHGRVDEEKKRGSAAGEKVIGNNHIGGLGPIHLLPLAQVPKISRRICFKTTPWYAIVPPRCSHCFSTLEKTSVETTKQEYYHYRCNNYRNVFFLKPLEDINHCFRSQKFHYQVRSLRMKSDTAPEAINFLVRSKGVGM